MAKKREGFTVVGLQKLKAELPAGRESPAPGQQGFSVLKLPSGELQFRLTYFFNGQRRRISFGTFDRDGRDGRLTLAAAAALYDEARALLRTGIDPKAQRDALRTEAARAALEAKRAPTFAALFADYDTRELSTKRTGADLKRLIERNALPTLGPRKLKEITRREVVEVLNAIRDGGAPATADKVTTILVRCFNYACEQGFLDLNPLAGIRRGQTEPRARALSDDEVRAVWHGLDGSDMHRSTALALKLILVTGQRPGEVAGLCWAEIEGHVWTIPATRAKNGRAHRVPLSALALELLAEAGDVAGDSDHAFPSPRGMTDRPMDRHSLSRAVSRNLERFGTAAWTPHDLRRTMRTGLAALGIAHEIAERVVGHAQDKLTATYNQHSYDCEKRAALDTWARRLAEIVHGEPTGTNVVRLKRTAGT